MQHNRAFSRREQVVWGLILTLLLDCLFPTLCLAGPGTSGGTILNFPIGARAIAMGEAYTALADDVSSLYWNPAGIALLNQSQASFLYNQTFQEQTFQNIAVATPLEEGGIGASISHLSYGSIDGYDANKNPTGNINAYSGVATLGGGMLFGPLSIGASLVGVKEKLADTSASGIAGDLGATYTFQRDIYGSTLRAATTLRHWGSGLKFIDQRDPFPTEWRMGLAALQVWDRRLNFSLDYGKQRDIKGSVYTGGEFWLFPMLALRAGYAGSDQEGSGARLGVGLRIKNMSFDYAYSGYGDLGLSHRFELSTRFGVIRPDLTPEERKMLKRAKLALAKGWYEEAILILDSLRTLEPHYSLFARLEKVAMRGSERQASLMPKPAKLIFSAHEAKEMEADKKELTDLLQIGTDEEKNDSEEIGAVFRAVRLSAACPDLSLGENSMNISRWIIRRTAVAMLATAMVLVLGMRRLRADDWIYATELNCATSSRGHIGGCIVKADITPPFTAESCTARTGAADCTVKVYQHTSENIDSLVIDHQGRLIFDLNMLGEIHRIDADGSNDTLLADHAIGISGPQDLVMDPTGKKLYVANYAVGTISTIDLNGPFPNNTVCGRLPGIEGMAFDKYGHFFANAGWGDPAKSGIYRLDPTTCGVLQSTIGIDPALELDGLAYNPVSDRLFAASSGQGGSNSIFVIDANTLVGSKLASVPQPDGLISDFNGTIYVASQDGHVYGVRESDGQVTQLTPVHAADDLGIPPLPPPSIVSFAAVPRFIYKDEISTLSWTVNLATAATIDPTVGSIGLPSGSQAVSPVITTTYTLTAFNAAGSTQAFATVALDCPRSDCSARGPGYTCQPDDTCQKTAPRIVSFTADPTTVWNGEPSTLSWVVSGASSISIDQSIGPVNPIGSTSVTPSVTTTYTLTATNLIGTVTATVTVTVACNAVDCPLPNVCVSNNVCRPPPPAAVISADPGTIYNGQISTLTWTTAFSTSATLDDGASLVAVTPNVSGDTKAVKPAHSTTYTLRAFGLGGPPDPALASVTVIVACNPTNCPLPNQCSTDGTERCLPPPPTIELFSATPNPIYNGENSVLAWRVTGNVTTVSIDNGVGVVNPGGYKTINSTTTTAYKLVATGPGGPSQGTTTLVVDCPNSDCTTTGGVCRSDNTCHLPPPTLTALNPNQAVARTPIGDSLGMTVTGTYFTSASSVLWNGSPLVTVFDGATELLTKIPDSLLASAGSALVTVQDSGQTSNAMPFTILAPARLSKIVVTPDVPDSKPIAVLAKQDFHAQGYDQYGGPFDVTEYRWSVQGLYGSISNTPSPTGTFQAMEGYPGSRIRYTVTATAFGISGSAHVTVLEPSPYPSDICGVFPYPVPYKADSGLAGVTFQNLGPASKIRIFTSDGRLVRTLWSQYGKPTMWDLLNDEGAKVASGVYPYFVDEEGPCSRKKGKLVIIR